MFFSRERKKKTDFYIMIIDDEKDFLSSMEFWFKSQGYSVKALSSTEEALGIIKKKLPSVIFLNLQMPHDEGIETLRRIREVDATIPVIMLSAYGYEDSHIDAYKLGVNGFFDKSHNFYQAEHLINCLVRIVSRKRSPRPFFKMGRRQVWLFIILFLLVAVGLLLTMPASLGRICFKSSCLKVELAVTEEQRARGLMHRLSLAKNHGMFFIFPNDDRWSFWMKNTRIPLDIIWLDKNKIVVDIAKGAQPSPSENPPVFKSVFPARFVLEANAGFVQENGIRIGDEASFK